MGYQKRGTPLLSTYFPSSSITGPPHPHVRHFGHVVRRFVLMGNTDLVETEKNVGGVGEDDHGQP